jgi:heme-degrading monooxygenase HmoA
MPEISQDKTLQTIITTYEVTPGTCHDLLDELARAYEEFVIHQPGFIGAAVHVNDAHTRIASYSQWQRREDFQAVLRSAEMRERNRRFSELSKNFEPVMYDVVRSFG